MSRNFYVSRRPTDDGAINQSGGTLAASTQNKRSPNVIQFPAVSSQGPVTSGRHSTAARFFSSAKQFAIDLAAVAAAAVLVCATATAIGASMFILLFVRL